MDKRNFNLLKNIFINVIFVTIAEFIERLNLKRQ